MSSQSKLLLPISPLSSVSSEHHVTIWALVSGIHEAVGAEGDGRATPEAQDTQNCRDEPGVDPGLHLYTGGDLEQVEDAAA